MIQPRNTCVTWPGYFYEDDIPPGTAMKLKVSEQALVARINRKLKRGAQALFQSFGAGAEEGQCHYCLLDWRRNSVDAEHVDLETLGRALAVLHSHEELVRSE